MACHSPRADGCRITHQGMKSRAVIRLEAERTCGRSALLAARLLWSPLKGRITLVRLLQACPQGRQHQWVPQRLVIQSGGAGRQSSWLADERHRIEMGRDAATAVRPQTTGRAGLRTPAMPLSTILRIAAGGSSRASPTLKGWPAAKDAVNIMGSIYSTVAAPGCRDAGAGSD